MGLHHAGLKLSKRSLDVWQEVHAASPVRYAQALGNYGYGLVLSGRSDLALQPLQESQAQLEQLLPADDETVAVARLLTAKAHAFLLHLQSALELLMAVVEDAQPGSDAAGEAVDMLAAIAEAGDPEEVEADGRTD
jgi:hypothetical protein